jgi:hypothetical protein
MKLSEFNNATIEVKSAIPKAPEKLDELREKLQSRIIVELREQKTFEKIDSQAETDSHSDLRIEGIITNVHDIDSFDRAMGCAFAIQARTNVTVEFGKQTAEK